MPPVLAERGGEYVHARVAQYHQCVPYLIGADHQSVSHWQMVWIITTHANPHKKPQEDPQVRGVTVPRYSLPLR